MRIPNPIATTTTEAYLAYRAEFLAKADLKEKLYHPYLHIDGWLAYWTGLTGGYPVKGLGNNLLDINSFSKGRVDNGIIGYQDGTTSFSVSGDSITMTTNANYRGIVSRLIPVKPNTTYIELHSGDVGRFTDFYDIFGNWISRATSNPSTTPENCYYVRISFQLWQAGTATISDLQFEEGSTATPYEPYTGEPECLTDEEAYIAYLAGVTSEYPEALKDPADVRVASYLRYLVSARFGRPDYPVTREEFYLSMMKPAFIPSGDPSSSIEIDGTVEAPFVDVKMYGDTFQQTYSGKNLFNVFDKLSSSNVTVDSEGWMTCTIDNTSGSSTVYGTYFTNSIAALQTSTTYAIVMEVKSVSGTGTVYPTQGSSSLSQFTSNISVGFGTVTAGGVYVYTQSTKPSFSGTTISLRNAVSFAAGQSGSITFRMSILADTTITPSTFSYEPYVGGTASPNPDYPQEIQTVTGEQTVKVTGKNLFSGDYAQFNNAGGTGSLYSYFALPDDSEYRLTLVAKSNIPTFSGQHAIGFTKNGGDAANGYTWVVFKEPGAAPLNVGDVFARSSTVPQKFGFVSIYPGTSENLQWFVDNFEIQLEKNSSSTSYEPYQSQSYKINLGKNLLDMATLVDGYVTSSGTFETAHPLGEMRSDFIKVVPDTTYTFSIIETTDTNQSWFGVGEYSSRDTGSFIRRDVDTAATATSITFTTSATTQYIVVSARNLAGATKAQLELGSATSYAPYFEPIELCKIGNYQDYIYKSGDDWYVHKAIGKVILNGNENVAVNSTGTTNWYYAITNGYDNAASNSIISSHYIYNGSITASNTIQGASITSGGTIRVRFEPEDTTVNYKTWLTSNNVTIYYALATPTDTQITNENLIAQLDTLKEGGSYNDKTYIKVTATDPNLPGLLYVEAAV